LAFGPESYKRKILDHRFHDVGTKSGSDVPPLLGSDDAAFCVGSQRALNAEERNPEARNEEITKGGEALSQESLHKKKKRFVPVRLDPGQPSINGTLGSSSLLNPGNLNRARVVTVLGGKVREPG